MGAQVIWLVAKASRLVALVKTFGTTFPCRALERTLPLLKLEAQRFVVVVMSDAALRNGYASCLLFVLSFKLRLLVDVHLLLLRWVIHRWIRCTLPCWQWCIATPPETHARHQWLHQVVLDLQLVQSTDPWYDVKPK